LAAGTEGFSGADIAGVCHKAALKALRRVVQGGGGEKSGKAVDLRIRREDLSHTIEEVK
jgi:SpoVK/Ycf46/Vps4 family AAA+-type ATPase